MNATLEKGARSVTLLMTGTLNRQFSQGGVAIGTTVLGGRYMQGWLSVRRRCYGRRICRWRHCHRTLFVWHARNSLGGNGTAHIDPANNATIFVDNGPSFLQGTLTFDDITYFMYSVVFTFGPQTNITSFRTTRDAITVNFEQGPSVTISDQRI